MKIKRGIVGLASTLFTAVLSWAAPDSSSLPSPSSSSLPTFPLTELDAGALQPLVEVIRPFLVKASLLVGGIFGIYIILILVRIHYERRTMKLLQHIRYDLDQQNHHYGIPSSLEKKGFWHGLIVDNLVPAHRQKHNTVFSSKPPPQSRKKA